MESRKCVALEQHDMALRARELRSGGRSGGTAADDHHITIEGHRGHYSSSGSRLQHSGACSWRESVTGEPHGDSGGSGCYGTISLTVLPLSSRNRTLDRPSGST